MTGDEGARRDTFERLTAQVYEPLQRYLRRRCSPADADDVFVDALTVLWRRLEELPPDHELPWAYGVARRCLANHRRGGSRQLRLLTRIGEHHAPAGQEQWTSAADAALHDALGRLPDLDREVVRLWAWERLEPREIAEVLETTPNAVSVRLQRIQRRLAADIARQDRVPAGQERVVSREGRDR